MLAAKPTPVALRIKRKPFCLIRRQLTEVHVSSRSGFSHIRHNVKFPHHARRQPTFILAAELTPAALRIKPKSRHPTRRKLAYVHVSGRPGFSRVRFNVKFPRHAVGRQRLHPVHLASMRSQVARAGELAPADLTLVRLLAGVHPLVVIQAPGAGECRVTLTALERLAAGVGAQVGVEAGPLAVAHPAYLAAVGPLPVVVQQMLGQVVAEEEGLGAVRTGELPGRAVSLQVHVQQLDRLAAQVAHLPGAEAPVSVYLLPVLKRHPARLAHQRLQLCPSLLQPLATAAISRPLTRLSIKG